MTETTLKEPESNRIEMSHTTVKLETMTAESKQHVLELETMRQKYEAWMKRAENLTNENELLKRDSREGKSRKTYKEKDGERNGKILYLHS